MTIPAKTLTNDAPDIQWEHEDQLPTWTDAQYDAAYPLSRVFGRVGVRMFPYATIDGQRVYLAAVDLVTRKGA